MEKIKYLIIGNSAGMVSPPDKSYEVLSKKHEHTYRKVILKDGLLTGMVFVGDIEKSGIVFSLMRDREDVSSFKQALVADDFGLTSLPEGMWRPRLEAPPSLLAMAAAASEQPEEMVVGE